MVFQSLLDARRPLRELVERDNNFPGCFFAHLKYLVDQIRKLGKLLERDLEQLPLGAEIHVVSGVEADEAGMQLSRCVKSSWRVLPVTSKILGVYGDEGVVLCQNVFHQGPVSSTEQAAVA